MAAKDLGDRLGGKGWLGWAIGTVVLAPVVVPALGKALRPVAKEAIKGFLALSERAQEMIAEAGEQMQDLVAEAKVEYAQEAAAVGKMGEAPQDQSEETTGGETVVEAGGEQDGAGRQAPIRPSAAEAEAI